MESQSNTYGVTVTTESQQQFRHTEKWSWCYRVKVVVLQSDGYGVAVTTESQQ
jgi:hypothetical protein